MPKDRKILFSNRLALLLFGFTTALSLFTGELRAQPPELPAPQRLTEREGLPQAATHGVVQDRQGFIWIATRDGLCRYDGQQFKIFQPNPDRKSSLSYAGLGGLTLDHRGRIWITSERSDIDLLDPLTETFTNISRQPTYQWATRGRKVSFYRYDRQERLWVVMSDDAEIFRYNFKNHEAKRFLYRPGEKSAKRDSLITDLVEGIDGRIWLSTVTGLKYLDPATDRFTDYLPLANTTDYPRRLYARRGDARRGVARRGVAELLLFYPQRLDRLQTGVTPGVDSPGVESPGVATPDTIISYPFAAGTNSWQSYNFVQDGQERVYFNHDFELYVFTDRGGVQTLARRSPTQILEQGAKLWLDRSGVLWESTAGAGVRTYDLTPNPFQATPYRHSFHADLRRELGLDTLSGQPVALQPGNGLKAYQFRYANDGRGGLWLNVGSSEVLKLDRRAPGPAAGRLTTHPLPVDFYNLSAEDTPCPLASDPDGKVWAVYDSLVWQYDESTAAWRRFPYHIPHERTSDVLAFTVDRQALWLATKAKGLWRLDRQTGRLRQYANQPGDARSLSYDALLCLSDDPADSTRLWVGTYGRGLCAFDKQTGYFQRFLVADGLPNNVIYSVIPDQHGYLWMGTNKGICRFNRATFATTNYTREHGLQADEFNRFHWLYLPAGKNAEARIVMGGLEGITSFHPVEVGQDEFQPAVGITALLVNNEPAPAALTDSLPPQAVRSLTLAHDQNFVTAEFAALQFNRPDNNRYRYRLEGLEDEWKESTRPVATYTNLPPGEYALLLNASNTSGQWSGKVRRLAITIRPPLWATWWAYLLYALTVAGLAWAGSRSYINRVKIRQELALQTRENALRQQEAEQLRAMDEMKSDFFANMTHEFRTPLTLILAPTEQLQRERPDPTNYRRHLSTINRNVRRLLGLVDQLLDFSKLEAGALPVVELRGNLKGFVAQTVDSFRELARERGIELNFTDENLAQTYWFDTDKLERILYNLLSNALNYTERGRVSVLLSGVESGVEVVVEDTGPGIAADQLGHIFDRYYRVGNNGRSDNPSHGTGLGLALVRELVDLQNGRITVNSEPGRGTTFVVELPYRPESTSSAEAGLNSDGVAAVVSGADAAPPVAELPPDDAPLVLVVEDNDELARYIAESLPADYRLLRAGDGQQGWELAVAELPDLILSDVMMPIMDGYALCQKLKTDLRTNHIPVLLLTAKASLDNRLEGLELGADDYLPKPFHVAELLLRVRNQLESKRRLRQQLRAELGRPSGPTEANPASENPFLRRLYALLDENLHDEQLSIEQLTDWLDMSRMTFYRKLSALTDLTPAELIRLHRLKRATHHLRQGMSVAETAYRVGFKTTSHFTRVFREQYQVTPAKFARQKG